MAAKTSWEMQRRRVLRGMFAGSAVAIGLPVLECLLNTNGVALADGAPLPTRFASWFWGLGFNPGRWEPQKVGSLADQSLGPDLLALEPVKDKINIFSKLTVPLDGRPNLPHYSGWMTQLTGSSPPSEAMSLPTVDTMIADAISTNRRFRSLVVSCSGDPRDSVSYRAAGAQEPADVSPLALYQRIYGPGFTDPNGADFKPDPRVLAQRSALSFVKDQRDAVARGLGKSDLRRLDEYYTSLRQLEQQIALQLEKPAPLEACTLPAPPEESKPGAELETSLRTNALMAGLLAHALACDQTRAISVTFSAPSSTLLLPGEPNTHHGLSHFEPVDSILGYQKKFTQISARSIEGLKTLIETLASFKEGDSTLLDRTLLLATTDVGHAVAHGLEDIPVITAGRANGTLKTGRHVELAGDTPARVILTVMQGLKMPVGSFGTESNQTSRVVSEVLA